MDGWTSDGFNPTFCRVTCPKFINFQVFRDANSHNNILNIHHHITERLHEDDASDEQTNESSTNPEDHDGV